MVKNALKRDPLEIPELISYHRKVFSGGFQSTDLLRENKNKIVLLNIRPKGSKHNSSFFYEGLLLDGIQKDSDSTGFCLGYKVQDVSDNSTLKNKFKEINNRYLIEGQFFVGDTENTLEYPNKGVYYRLDLPNDLGERQDKLAQYSGQVAVVFTGNSGGTEVFSKGLLYRGNDENFYIDYLVGNPQKGQEIKNELVDVNRLEKVLVSTEGLST